jgi:Phosphotransferase enzyme family
MARSTSRPRAESSPRQVIAWRDRPLDDLLAEFDLAGIEERPLATDGWSGSTFSAIERGHERFVLKRTSASRDWIVRATRDDGIREAWLANARTATIGWLSDLGGERSVAYLGAAADANGEAAILMPDLSTELVAWERPTHEPVLDVAATDRLIDRIALLHSLPWSEILTSTAARSGGPPPPWCPLPERLTLLTRRSATGYAADQNPVGEIFLRGWDAFEAMAPRPARDLLDRLGADVAPLVAALGTLPSVGLHGDIKLANVALLERDRVAFIDWQMTLQAPVAVELGWFMVTNSAELPFPPDEVLRRYRESIGWYAGRWGSGTRSHDLDGLIGDWDAQRDLAMVVGLLLRGWRKGRDAEAGVVLASGVPAADDLAWWCERAVEAADRRL